DINDFWEYNPVTDAWTQVADFGGGQRELAQGFSVGCKGYFGAGIINDANQHSDFWEYTPNSYVCVTGVNDISTSATGLIISLNPANDQLIISAVLTAGEKKEINITDVNGKNVFRQTFVQRGQMTIDISSFAKGIYFVIATNGKEKIVKKFLKE